VNINDFLHTIAALLASQEAASRMAAAGFVRSFC
jgi:hypothetical protein